MRLHQSVVRRTSSCRLFPSVVCFSLVPSATKSAFLFVVGPAFSVVHSCVMFHQSYVECHRSWAICLTCTPFCDTDASSVVGPALLLWVVVGHASSRFCCYIKFQMYWQKYNEEEGPPAPSGQWCVICDPSSECHASLTNRRPFCVTRRRHPSCGLPLPINRPTSCALTVVRSASSVVHRAACIFL